MGVEENPITPSAADQRWDLINSILKKHEPFPDEPFHPRSIVVRVRKWPHLPFTTRVKLDPVAFEPRIFGFGMMGVISLTGGMNSYLYLDPEGRLVRESVARRDRYRYVDDPFSITDEDIERLRIGVKGDNALIKA